MKRLREIDLEAPVREDDDGEDEGDGGQTVTSALDEKSFTKKGRWIHNRQQSEISQNVVPSIAGKWPRDSASPRGIDSEQLPNPGFLEFQAQRPGIAQFEEHHEDTARNRTLPHLDLQTSMSGDSPQSRPQGEHETGKFEAFHNVLESEQLSLVKDRQVTEESVQGTEQRASRGESPPAKKEKGTFPSPLAVILYSEDYSRQDVKLHSTLEKQGALFSQVDLSDRLETICFIGQHIELIKESRTRKLVTDIIQQELWKAEEPLVIQALVKVLCSVAHISCVDDCNEDECLGWASYVARFLLQYITTKDARSSPLKSGLKVQLLRSLSIIGKDGGTLELASVGPLAKEQLRSSNPRLREYGVRLLVESIKERNAVGSRDLKDCKDLQRSVAEGDSLMHTLLDYTRDPFPNVREAVVWAILHLHRKGFALKLSTYKFAVALLRDSFEAVRICAIKLVGTWIKAAAWDDLEGSHTKYVDYSFLQICNMMTDMTMSVRQEACNVLAEMTGVSDSVLLQSLTKKISTTSGTEKGSSVGGSSSISDANMGVANFEENKLFDWSAAGAFVVGLEDEFWEVRSAAVKALAMLGLSSEKMAHNALELIVDMINDDSDYVREQTIQALTNLALAGRLSILEAHLHMFIGILEDSKVEMRKWGHDLLSAVSLPSIATFQLTIRAILTSLDKHPEDEESLLVTLEKLARSHPSHTESMADELVQELKGLWDEDSGLDKPRFGAILVLLLGAATTNKKIISLIPSRIISVASLIRNKLPTGLPALHVVPVGFKSMLYAWSTTDASLSRENHSEDQSRGSHRKWRQVNGSQPLLENRILESKGRRFSSRWNTKDSLNDEGPIATFAERGGNQRSVGSSVTVTHYQESQLDQFAEQKILESTQQIVASALRTTLLLDMKAFKEALQRLRGCRKELKSLKKRCSGLQGIVSFCGLYLECLILLVQLRASFVSQESSALVKMSGLPHDLVMKLESVLKYILHRFSDFNVEQILQVLELHAINYVWKLALLPLDHLVEDGPSSKPFLELVSTVTTAEKITKSQDLPPSSLLRSVKEQFLYDKGKTNTLSIWRSARQLALSYWPIQISVDSSVKEVQAVMKAPGSDFDHPLGFIAGLPLGIPIDVTLYNVPSMCSLWIQFVQGTSATGYKLLDVADSDLSSTRRICQLSTLLQLDDMPPVASSLCRLCVVMAGYEHQRSPNNVGSGKGPAGCIIPICTEMEVHLYRIRERGSKQPPHGKR